MFVFSILLISLFVIIQLLYLIRKLFGIILVIGDSMQPTLNHGDKLLIIKRGKFIQPRLNQIVIVQPPHKIAGTPPSIKRIVGISGDVVRAPIFHLASDTNPDGSIKIKKLEKSWNIPAHSIFVLGDKLESSEDSRNWGPIPISSVAAIVLHKIT